VRTEARFNPEEINRRVADVLSDVLFANIKESYDNLLKENFSPDDVFLPGDVVMDMVMYAVEAFQLEVRRDDYHLLTIHRAENASVPERLTEIIEGLLACGEKIVFPAHPRTRKALEDNGMLKKLQDSNIELMPPLGYKDFMSYLAGANKVVSDSGGVRREAYILGKPVISLIEFVWVPSMVECGWEKVVGPNKGRIVDAIHYFEPPAERPQIFGDGKAAERIVEILLQRYG
jgi:UDP-N-acetylglucosamine 2-epimerase